MRYLALLLCAMVALSCLASAAAARKHTAAPLMTDAVRQQFKILSDFNHEVSAASSKHKLDASNIECGLCAIVINELEGFIAENLTLSEMEQALKTDVCSRFQGSAAGTCGFLVSLLPQFVAGFESFATVSTVCVDLGLCSRPIGTHSDPVAVPSYTINLDLPPAQRFQEVCSVPAFQAAAQNLVNSVVAVLPNGGADIEKVGNMLYTNYYPYEQSQEIQGCAQYLGVSAGWLAILNIGYEATDACTSIVAQTNDGQIYHARNLDFWTGIWLTDQLRNMTFQGEFQQNGQLLFHATTFAGYVGVLSGQKPGQYSVTIDTRFYPKNGLENLFGEIIAAISATNASLVSFLSRNVLTNENDFDAALNQLSNSMLIADVYYILAGASANQGAVISRNRDNATDVWLLDVPTRWFEVETNYDHWKPAPWFDDRVVPANEGMNKMGRNNLSLQGMFNVLSTKPVFNIQTTYTILSCPATGYYQSWTRYCPYPCSE